MEITPTVPTLEPPAPATVAMAAVHRIEDALLLHRVLPRYHTVTSEATREMAVVGLASSQATAPPRSGEACAHSARYPRFLSAWAVPQPLSPVRSGSEVLRSVSSLPSAHLRPIAMKRGFPRLISPSPSADAEQGSREATGGVGGESQPPRFCFLCGAAVPPWRDCCFVHDQRLGRGLPAPARLLPMHEYEIDQQLTVMHPSVNGVG